MPSASVSRRAFLSALSVSTTVGVAGCTSLSGTPTPEPIPEATSGPADWPTSGYDAQNTRYNAAAAPPRSEPTPRWARRFSSCYEPVVRGARVVLNAGDRMVGLRSTDGDRVWQSDSEPWGFEAPTLGTERAYVTGTDCVFGVDLETGEETWHGRPCHGANTSSGTLANGRLYLEHGGYFSALDATGRTTWASRHDAQGSPAVTAETAFVATVFAVEAVDLTTRATEWPWEDSDNDEPPHVDQEAATKWSVPSVSRIGGPRVYRSPAVTAETVYTTVERQDRPGGELRALTRADGEERWRLASPPRQRTEEDDSTPEPVGRPVAPVVAEDLVVTALGDRRLRAVSPDGDSVWSSLLDHEILDLAGAGDTLLAVTHDRSVETTAPGHGSLSAFDLNSGKRLWTKRFEDHVEALAVADGTVYATVVTERRSDGSVTEEQLLALG